MWVAIANGDGKYLMPISRVSERQIELLIENLFVTEYDVPPFTITIIGE